MPHGFQQRRFGQFWAAGVETSRPRSTQTGIKTWRCSLYQNLLPGVVYTQCSFPTNAGVFDWRANRNDLKSLNNIRVCGRYFIAGKGYPSKQIVFHYITHKLLAMTSCFALRVVYCTRLRAMCFYFLRLRVVTLRR